MEPYISEWAVVSPLIDTIVLNATISDFPKNLAGKFFSQTEWEDSFERVAQLKVPGYIAIMQLEFLLIQLAGRWLIPRYC